MFHRFVIEARYVSLAPWTCEIRKTKHFLKNVLFCLLRLHHLWGSVAVLFVINFPRRLFEQSDEGVHAHS